MDLLGIWLTPVRLKPWQKKVDGIVDLAKNYQTILQCHWCSQLLSGPMATASAHSTPSYKLGRKSEI